MTATDDFSVTANSGVRLEATPLPDGHPGADGLVAAADRPPLFKVAGETDLPIGMDGNDVGPAWDQAIRDMLDSGHGYLVRAIDRQKTVWRVTCEVCNGPLPTPGDDPEWLCQLGDETEPASLTCVCPWCRMYQDYVSGRYKPQGGRPRQRCGSKECDRRAKTAAQKERRLQERRKRILVQCSSMADEPPPTLADIEAGRLRIDEVPDVYRDSVRAKLEARASELRRNTAAGNALVAG